MEKEIEVEMTAELYSFLLENKFKNGMVYIRDRYNINAWICGKVWYGGVGGRRKFDERVSEVEEENERIIISIYKLRICRMSLKI